MVCNRIILAISAGAIVALSITADAQTDTTDRSVSSKGFVVKRPIRAGSAAKRKSSEYRYKGTDNFYKRTPPKRAAASPVAGSLGNTRQSSQVETSLAGLTIWKLRPAREGEDGFFFEVKDDGGLIKLFLAERVDIDSGFSEGDRVRFGIESQLAGYLYIFDRETYSDGTLGQPRLLFPESELQDNSIVPGMLVDVPDQRASINRFKFEVTKTNYTGELITVVISPTRLPPIKTDVRGHLLDIEPLLDIEYKSSARFYSRSDMEDKLYSKAESEAACGSKTRELVPDAARTKTRPCGTMTRELTPDGPAPQAIYEVTHPKGRPFALLFRLAVQSKPR